MWFTNENGWDSQIDYIISSYLPHTSTLSLVCKASHQLCRIINEERTGRNTCCNCETFVRCFNKASRVYEDLAIVRTVTSRSNVEFWAWAAASTWVQNAAREEGLCVVDMGSGINSLCIMGAVVSELNIKMAIGIDADVHKVSLAAQLALV